MKFLKNRNINVTIQNGNIVVSGPNSEIISENIKSNKYFKIALLEEALNYERPVYSSAKRSIDSK